jgi:hypothetical protein
MPPEQDPHRVGRAETTPAITTRLSIKTSVPNNDPSAPNAQSLGACNRPSIFNPCSSVTPPKRLGTQPYAARFCIVQQPWNIITPDKAHSAHRQWRLKLNIIDPIVSPCVFIWPFQPIFATVILTGGKWVNYSSDSDPLTGEPPVSRLWGWPGHRQTTQKWGSRVRTEVMQRVRVHTLERVNSW